MKQTDRNRRIGTTPERQSTRPATPESPYDVQKKLHNVLQDRVRFMKSAMLSFHQFDKDKSGTLSFEECRALIDRLVVNLSLPPIDDATLLSIFNRYNTSETDELNPDDFSMMFWQILLRVRDKYYPNKAICIRRSFFVGRVALAEDQMKSEVIHRHHHLSGLFEFKRSLGAGSFGQVHLVVERSSNLVRCCKTINKDKAAVPVEQLEAEIEVLKALDHPNVIKILEVYEDYNNLYIIQEVCEGGELLGRITEAADRGKVLTEKYVRDLTHQLLSALAYIHSLFICHKDLKPQNILFQDSTPRSAIKIIDFGLAEIFERSNETSEIAAGTVLYMAPEVFGKKVCTKSDIWSVGCITFLLMTGHLPFHGRFASEVQNKILRSEPAYEKYCQHISSDALAMLKCLLEKNPRNRISAKEALKHRWFKDPLQQDIELSLDVCDNLKKYARHSGIKAALINLMTHQLNFNNSQVKQLSALFKQMDRDNSGTLSATELRCGLEQAGIPQWDIVKITHALDMDGSGEIAYTEFLAAAYTWREAELNVVWTAFSKIDTDGDGKISVQEFLELLSGGGNVKLVRSEDMTKMIQKIDRDGDGLIDWDEFLHYMRTTAST